MIVLETSDFEEGFYRIPFSEYTEVSLQEVINDKEEYYLSMLLGIELKDLFVADLSGGVPVSAIYLDIFNPFIKDINECKYQSLGIKTMLKGFIYWEYMREANYKVSESANLSVLNENSSALEFENNEILAEKRYNRSKFTGDAIQQFICDNDDVYPTYDGEEFRIKYSLVI